jgi:asparaginyl-tRNA synthetase
MAETIKQLANQAAAALNISGPSSGAIYVDEKTGSDTEGKGTEASPFASLFAAYQSLNPAVETDAEPLSAANFQVRKVEGDKAEWVEPSASAKKKLAKLIDLWRKKEARAAADAVRLAKEKEEHEAREAAKREAAQSIVLTDDKSAKKVRLHTKM